MRFAPLMCYADNNANSELKEDGVMWINLDNIVHFEYFRTHDEKTMFDFYNLYLANCQTLIVNAQSLMGFVKF